MKKILIIAITIIIVLVIAFLLINPFKTEISFEQGYNEIKQAWVDSGLTNESFSFDFQVPATESAIEQTNLLKKSLLELKQKYSTSLFSKNASALNDLLEIQLSSIDLWQEQKNIASRLIISEENLTDEFVCSNESVLETAVLDFKSWIAKSTLLNTEITNFVVNYPEQAQTANVINTGIDNEGIQENLDVLTISINQLKQACLGSE